MSELVSAKLILGPNRIVRLLSSKTRLELELSDADQNLFFELVNSYQKIVTHNSHVSVSLQDIGSQIYDWLDDKGLVIPLLESITSYGLLVSFGVEDPKLLYENLIYRLFLQVPWVLVHDRYQYWAVATDILFEPYVEVAGAEPSILNKSEYSTLLFMAAAPEGFDILAYEAEEQSILRTCKGLNIYVEETGTLSGLLEQIKRLNPGIVHISCHGKFLSDGRPYIVLEDEVGQPRFFDHEMLVNAIFSAAIDINLVFLSACSTDLSLHDLDIFTESYLHGVVALGIPATIGWAGPIQDEDASLFAAAFYKALSKGADLQLCVAQARRELFESNLSKANRNQNWHLARLFVHSQRCPATYIMSEVYTQHDIQKPHKTFLDARGARSPVASPEYFVGRRRQLQFCLREFDNQNTSGILIHGVGQQGKSSLAARLALRLSQDHEILVIYGVFTIQSFLDSLSKVYPSSFMDIYNDVVQHLKIYPDSFLHCLPQLLRPLPPILIIIDDLEQVLQAPSDWQLRPKLRDDLPEARLCLQALLSYFKKDRGSHKLIITSRYRFELTDQYANSLTKELAELSLSGLETYEAEKQIRSRMGGYVPPGFPIQRLIIASAQNPGILDLLIGLWQQGLTSKIALVQAEEALSQMELFLHGGKIPNQDDLQSYLEKIAVEALLEILTDEEKRWLQYSLLFRYYPIPESVFLHIGEAFQLTSYERIKDLGLWAQFTDPVNTQFRCLAVNAIVWPYVQQQGSLDYSDETLTIAEIATRVLKDTWPDVTKLPDVAAMQVAELALCSGDSQRLREAAFSGFMWLRERISYPESAAFGQAVLDQLSEDSRLETYPMLILEVGRVWRDAGEPDLARKLFEQAKDIFKGLEDKKSEAEAMGEVALILGQQGQPTEALKLFRTELAVYEQLDDVPARASTMGNIAWLLRNQGEPDQALELFHDALVIYQKLGNRRSEAITIGHIASIIHDQGRPHEALKMLQQQLVANDQLGNLRNKAITLGEMAKIHQNLGDISSALFCHQQQLNISKQLGHKSFEVLALGEIAGIHEKQGKVDEAKKLYQQALKVHESLGDKRNEAIGMGRMASLYAAQGKPRQALELFGQQLSVAQRLGDLHLQAANMSTSASILRDLSEFDKALQQLKQALDIYKKLHYLVEEANTLGSIARIKRDQGQNEEAIELHQQELELYKTLGYIEAEATAMGDLGHLLRDEGRLNEAQYYHQQAYDIYDTLHYELGKAVALGDIANILGDQGQYEQSIELHDQALQIYRSIGERRYEAVKLADIGRELYSKGDLSGALSLQEQSIKIFAELDDLHRKTLCLGEMARTLYDLGKFQEAINIHWQEIPFYESIDDTRSVGVTYFDIANIYSNQEDYVRALELYGQALSIFQNSGAQRLEAFTLNNIANIKRKQGNLREALTRHRSAMTICEALDDMRTIHVVHCDMAVCLFEMGEQEQAIANLKNSLSYFEGLENTRMMTIAARHLGYYFATLGQVDVAMSYYDKAWSLALQVGITHQIWDLGQEYGTWLLGLDSSDNRGQEILALAQRFVPETV